MPKMVAGEDKSLAERINKLSLAAEQKEAHTAVQTTAISINAGSSSTPGANRRAAPGYIPPHRRNKQDKGTSEATADVAAPSTHHGRPPVLSLNATAPAFAPSLQQGVEYAKPGSKTLQGLTQTHKKSTKRNKKQAKLIALDESQATPVQDATTRQPFNFRATKRLNVMERPVPTQTYLQHASLAPQISENSRPLLVILDLNGTLLVRLKYGGSNPFIPRPHLHEFLDYLFDNHIVMVWSSSKPQNVAKMCADLFTPDQRSKLAAVWARDKLRIPAHTYNEKVQVYKQLSWVWEDPAIQSKNPVSNTLWSQANTVLIDDSIEKAASEPHNLVELEEFTAAPEQMQADILGQAAAYLDTLRSQRDVSAYMRSQPFVYQAKVDRPPDEIDAVIARATAKAQAISLGRTE